MQIRQIQLVVIGQNKFANAGRSQVQRRRAAKTAEANNQYRGLFKARLRLEAKGLVSRRKAEVGKAFLYSAAADPSTTMGKAVARVLRRLFSNDSANLVASLFGRHEPSLDELERIKRLVDDLYAEKTQSEEQT